MNMKIAIGSMLFAVVAADQALDCLEYNYDCNTAACGKLVSGNKGKCTQFVCKETSTVQLNLDPITKIPPKSFFSDLTGDAPGNTGNLTNCGFWKQNGGNPPVKNPAFNWTSIPEGAHICATGNGLIGVNGDDWAVATCGKTAAPTAAPTTASPTSAAPTSAPTDAPTDAPTAPTEAPTGSPTFLPPLSCDKYAYDCTTSACGSGATSEQGTCTQFVCKTFGGASRELDPNTNLPPKAYFSDANEPSKFHTCDFFKGNNNNPPTLNADLNWTSIPEDAHICALGDGTVGTNTAKINNDWAVVSPKCATESPTDAPTDAPTASPTTASPTAPTDSPTDSPTASPTYAALTNCAVPYVYNCTTSACGKDAAVDENNQGTCTQFQCRTSGTDQKKNLRNLDPKTDLPPKAYFSDANAPGRVNQCVFFTQNGGNPLTLNADLNWTSIPEDAYICATGGTIGKNGNDWAVATCPKFKTDSPTSASPTSAAPTPPPTNATDSPTAPPTDAPTTASPTDPPVTPATDSPTAAPTEAGVTSAPTASPTEAGATPAPTASPTEAGATSAPTASPTEASATPSPTSSAATVQAALFAVAVPLAMAALA